MKIGKAFCSKENKNYSASEIKNLYFSDPIRYKSTFENNMFCPECRTAHVTCVKRQRPHFRKYGEEPHQPGCSLDVEKRKKPIANIKADGIVTDDDIKRQAHYLYMKNLQVQSNTKNKKYKIKKYNNKSSSNLFLPNIVKRRKPHLPEKNMLLPFSDIDYDKELLLYAKCKLQWTYKPGQELHFLDVIEPNTNIKKLSIRISSLVYKNMKDEHKSLSDNLYYIALNASVNSKFKHLFIKYITIILKHSNNIKELNEISH